MIKPTESEEKTASGIYLPEGAQEKPQTGKIPARYKEGGYIKKIPADPWNNDYIYLSPGVHGDYDIISYGPDGASGGDGDDADINSWEIE